MSSAVQTQNGVGIVADHFNPAPPSVIHLDLNSAFATIEQQSNPWLRGRPIAVAAYTSPRAIVIAPSVEAKRAGCKLRMTVAECRALCLDIVILPPDPPKYRYVNRLFARLLSQYTPDLINKSIDEFALWMAGTPSMQRGLVATADEIKYRIRRDIGSAITGSVGIGPNWFLAKTVAGLHKPDGLDVIDEENIEAIYRSLELRDLCGIDVGYSIRLASVEVYSVEQFAAASLGVLKAGFHSVLGFDWYARLRGWEVDHMEYGRKSYGKAYALPTPARTQSAFAPILATMVERMGARMRRGGYHAKAVAIGLVFEDHTYWGGHRRFSQALVDNQQLYRPLFELYTRAPRKGITRMNAVCFDLVSAATTQLALTEDQERTLRKAEAVDRINSRFGTHAIQPAVMLGIGTRIPDRISFGCVKDLTGFLFNATDIDDMDDGFIY